MHRSFLALAAIVAVAGAAAFIPACSDSGEGGRCDKLDDNAGNDDCQAGLSCVAGQSLPGHPPGDICCPTDLTYTDPICARVGGIDAGPQPVDASPSGADSGDANVVSDTGTDTGSDTGVDSGTDTGVDTGTDAGTDSGDAGSDAASDALADAPANG